MESFEGLESQILISYFLPISFVEQNTEKPYPLLLWSLSWTASKLQRMHMALLKRYQAKLLQVSSVCGKQPTPYMLQQADRKPCPDLVD